MHPHPPQPRLLTYGEVRRKIESCIDSGGEYTLRLWTQGTEPLLPKTFLQGRTRALYSAARVEELLKPIASK
jgi:hypothetical protein